MGGVNMCTRSRAFEILKNVYHASDPILEHSIHDAILFGSYARGDFNAESDIDTHVQNRSLFGQFCNLLLYILYAASQIVRRTNILFL